MEKVVPSSPLMGVCLNNGLPFIPAQSRRFRRSFSNFLDTDAQHVILKTPAIQLLGEGGNGNFDLQTFSLLTQNFLSK